MNQDELVKQKVVQKILAFNQKEKTLLWQQYKKANSTEKKIKILKALSLSMVYKPIGKYSSKKIESELLKLSAEFETNLSDSFKKNSFLHVFTETYSIGGHTRVCERWIENSPDDESHSVVVISQSKDIPIPKKLEQEAKKKKGDLIVMDLDLPPLEKAGKLRQLASSFERIILHAHMDDVIPLLAFGHPQFTRPIMLFDHGDHLFWLGVSIADLVINLRTYTSRLAKERRGVKDSVILPLPIEIPNSLNKKKNETDALKKELEIDPSHKVILTMASPYKFEPFEQFDFIHTMLKLLESTPNTTLLAIGPSTTEPNLKWRRYWHTGITASKGRIKPIGYIPNDQIDAYIQLADLAIDSFPFGSSTSILDIGKHHIPCLVRATPSNQLDSFEAAHIYCKTEEDLLNEAKKCLEKAPCTQPTLFYNVIQDSHFPDAFRKHLSQIYARCPNTHTLHDFQEDTPQKPTEFDLFNMKLFYFKDNGGHSRMFLRLIRLEVAVDGLIAPIKKWISTKKKHKLS